MFFAKKKDIELHSLDLNLVSIPLLELGFVHPLFLCEMLDVDDDEGGQHHFNSLTPALVPSLERLTALAYSNKIHKTYLISPGYMHESEKWSLDRLMEVSRADYFHEGHKSHVYRFQLEGGKSIDLDISGLNQNSKDLVFESILKLVRI